MPSSLAARLWSGIGRRMRYVGRTVTRGNRPPPVEAAVEWLLRAGQGDGVRDRLSDPAPCPRLTAACLETAMDFGLRKEAARWSRWIEEAGCAEAGEAPEGDSPVVALARRVCDDYRAGRRAEADRAMRRLERLQRVSGGFPQRAGWFGCATRAEESGWAVKLYLDAALLRVHAAFVAQWRRLPRSIDPGDGRVQAVGQWCDGLAPRSRLADLGCGRGRFFGHIAQRRPDLRLAGIDQVPAMLAELPQGVERIEGSLLRLPVADGTFDAALAVESIEHALLPDRAVAEMGRVVRPGGRVLVIDKDRRKQPLSEYEPWERWPSAGELQEWLLRFCDEVRVTPVAHLEGRPAGDLFLAASGRRREDGSGRPVASRRTRGPW